MGIAVFIVCLRVTEIYIEQCEQREQTRKHLKRLTHTNLKVLFMFAV